VREKEEVKLVSELMSENALSKLVSNSTHQIFLVKVVRLLEWFFNVFIKLAHQNS